MTRLYRIVEAYQWYAMGAFVVSAFATPLAVQVARRLGVLDMPDMALKPHARPTPYLGGTAILLGWVAASSAAMLSGVVDWRLMLPIVAGGIALSVIGLLDDVFNISVKSRLVAVSIVVAAVLLLTGAGARLADSVLGPMGVHLSRELSWAISFPMCLFIVLGACNSTNLIDGMDGLCTGVTGIISFGFSLLAAYLASYNHSPQGDPVRLVLALAMFGAAMGFLPLNFNPAKIFMGDAGSILLGYNCGIVILLFAERGIFRWVLGALMIFALPVFDTALAMFRRWRSGRSIFEGDRSHFYDQLRQRGLTVRQTVLVCYVLTVVYALFGLLVVIHGFRAIYAFPTYVAVAVGTAILAWRFKLTHPEEPGAGTGGPARGGAA